MKTNQKILDHIEYNYNDEDFKDRFQISPKKNEVNACNDLDEININLNVELGKNSTQEIFSNNKKNKNISKQEKPLNKGAIHKNNKNPIELMTYINEDGDVVIINHLDFFYNDNDDDVENREFFHLEFEGKCSEEAIEKEKNDRFEKKDKVRIKNLNKNIFKKEKKNMSPEEFKCYKHFKKIDLENPSLERSFNTSIEDSKDDFTNFRFYSRNNPIYNNIRAKPRNDYDNHEKSYNSAEKENYSQKKNNSNNNYNHLRDNRTNSKNKYKKIKQTNKKEINFNTDIINNNRYYNKNANREIAKVQIQIDTNVNNRKSIRIVPETSNQSIIINKNPNHDSDYNNVNKTNHNNNIRQKNEINKDHSGKNKEKNVDLNLSNFPKPLINSNQNFSKCSNDSRLYPSKNEIGVNSLTEYSVYAISKNHISNERQNSMNGEKYQNNKINKTFSDSKKNKNSQGNFKSYNFFN